MDFGENSVAALLVFSKRNMVLDISGMRGQDER